jgi:hypothetical protein
MGKEPSPPRSLQLWGRSPQRPGRYNYGETALGIHGIESWVRPRTLLGARQKILTLAGNQMQLSRDRQDLTIPPQKFA